MADDKIVFEYLRPEELQALIRERLQMMIDEVLAVKVACRPHPIRYKKQRPDERDPESLFEQPRPIKQ